MAEAFRGLYRTVAWAYVTNGAMAFQVPEAEYRAFGYQPEYNRLPWRDDYIASTVSATSAAPVQAAAPAESQQVPDVASQRGTARSQNAHKKGIDPKLDDSKIGLS
jgi:hypothetical protein